MPGGRERKETKPASLVSPTNSWFVAVFKAVTLAPGTVALVGSVTVPDIVPVAIPCENVEAARMRQAAAASKLSQSCLKRNFHVISKTSFKKNLDFTNEFIAFAPVNFGLQDEKTRGPH